MFHRGIAWLYAVVAIAVCLVRTARSDPFMEALQWQPAFPLFVWLHVGGVSVYVFYRYFTGGLVNRSQVGREPECQWASPVDVHTDNDLSLHTSARNGHYGPAMAAQIENHEAAIFPTLSDDVVRSGIWPRIYAGPSRFSGRTQQLVAIRSVCSSWRRWTESTQEYRDFRESWVEDQWQNDPEWREIDYSSSD